MTGEVQNYRHEPVWQVEIGDREALEIAAIMREEAEETRKQLTTNRKDSVGTVLLKGGKRVGARRNRPPMYNEEGAISAKNS